MSSDRFLDRHVGPSPRDLEEMLRTVGVASLDALIDETIPSSLRLGRDLKLPAALSERESLEALEARASQNMRLRSYLGMGYHGTITPPVIARNVLENPGWYTAYTPYQAEIAQGRLEALLNFQTVIQDLTALDISNASLLDEATAAAEAMAMQHRIAKGKRSKYFVASDCHPQTIAVVRTRAEPLGIEVVVGESAGFQPDESWFGVLVQYPGTDGRIVDPSALIARSHAGGLTVAMATDLLALTILRPPGELGVDIAVGSSQRFGVPMGYGGPHAAFLATREEHRRTMPGRIIGASIDADGHPALRMALQTREQHIRRQKATSNICTAQVLLAVIASMYAVWHGPDGLERIASRVHRQAELLAAGIQTGGYRVVDGPRFDTVRIECGADRDALVARALEAGINVRTLGDGAVVVALDETVRDADLRDLLTVFGATVDLAELLQREVASLPEPHARTSTYLEHPTFYRYRSETEMMRYLHRLASKDVALDTAMIALGSCTMKLNAASEMIPISMPGFSQLHPFVPADQARGYARLFQELEAWLCEITGFDALSLQPNAGSQGEYAGLMAIRRYHHARGDTSRDVCLIPTSAHGTNPASAVMAGLDVVAVACDDHGNIDVDDLRAKAAAHSDRLAALMVTYPSTHGVFEASIRMVCTVVHEHGGQVYMDGANMNAMVGLCRPADFGADVCHLNLHKTFAIPHGGGGPGMGPIGVRKHLAPFLPGHPVVSIRDGVDGTVSAAPWGSPSILPISWAYIAMLGFDGVRRATEVAILNANYVATRLADAYPVLYTGPNGRVAHECILDLRQLKAECGIEAEDVAKRLIDYGFHAPTMSFPVVGTLMVEPTESESKEELDRFCEAMLAIREEIRAVAEGRMDAQDNPLRNAPHTAAAVTADTWTHPYTRTEAAWPVPGLRAFKYWAPVRRVDNAYGDRHLVCSCHNWDPEA